MKMEAMEPVEAARQLRWAFLRDRIKRYSRTGFWGMASLALLWLVFLFGFTRGLHRKNGETEALSEALPQRGSCPSQPALEENRPLLNAFRALNPQDQEMVLDLVHRLPKTKEAAKSPLQASANPQTVWVPAEILNAPDDLPSGLRILTELPGESRPADTQWRSLILKIESESRIPRERCRLAACSIIKNKLKAGDWDEIKVGFSRRGFATQYCTLHWKPKDSPSPRLSKSHYLGHSFVETLKEGI